SDLVTVQIDAKAARRGKFAQGPYRRCPIAHGALEMRDTADDLDALVERTLKVRDRPRCAIVAVLRKRHELDVQIGRQPTLDLGQGIDRQQPIVANVDMAAD